MRLGRWAWVTIAIVVGIAGVAVAAAVVVLTQTLPGGSVAPGLSAGVCHTTLGATAATTGDFITYDCPLSTPAGPAFTVQVSGHYTPSFSLPSNYTDLYIFAHGTSLASANNCSTISGSLQLVSGAPVALGPPSTGFDYCIDYIPVSSTTSEPSLTVSWSQ